MLHTGGRRGRAGCLSDRDAVGAGDLGAGEMLRRGGGGEESLGQDEDRSEEGLVVEYCVGGDGGGGGGEWECFVGGGRGGTVRTWHGGCGWYVGMWLILLSFIRRSERLTVSVL